MARVLVVEDYPPLATVIAIGLRRLGHEVVRVGNVQRALATDGRFGCAVVDIDLPDGNGIDLADRLVAEGRAGVVVFFTATRDAAARERALAHGTLVDKTLGVEELARVVTEELAQRAELARAVGAPDAGSRASRRPLRHPPEVALRGTEGPNGASLRSLVC